MPRAVGVMLAITTVFFAAVADGACPLGGTLLDVSADEAHAVQYAGTCFEGGALRHEILNKPDCEAAAQALTGGTQTVTQETNTANPSKCYYDTTDCTFHFNTGATTHGAGSATKPKLCGAKTNAMRIDAAWCPSGFEGHTSGSQGWLLVADLEKPQSNGNPALCTACADICSEGDCNKYTLSGFSNWWYNGEWSKIEQTCEGKPVYKKGHNRFLNRYNNRWQLGGQQCGGGYGGAYQGVMNGQYPTDQGFGGTWTCSERALPQQKCTSLSSTACDEKRYHLDNDGNVDYANPRDCYIDYCNGGSGSNCATASTTKVYFVKADGSRKTGPYSFSTVRTDAWSMESYSCMHEGTPASSDGSCVHGQKCQKDKIAKFNLGGNLNGKGCASWCAGAKVQGKSGSEGFWLRSRDSSVADAAGVSSNHQGKCIFKDCNNCCQCDASWSSDPSWSTNHPNEQKICDAASNGCLANPLNGFGGQDMRAMLPCNTYGYGDFVVAEDINVWQTDCPYPDGTVAGTGWWQTLTADTATYKTSEGDIDWDGVKDFTWCAKAKDSNGNTIDRCHNAYRGTAQSWHTCDLKGWDPALTTLPPDVTTLLQAQTAPVADFRILLSAPTYFAQDQDCVCLCDFPRCQNGVMVAAAPNWKRVQMNPVITPENGHTWQGPSPGPVISGPCTVEPVNKQDCCTSKTLKFKANLTASLASLGLTRGETEWCTNVDDGIEAQIYPGIIRYTDLGHGMKHFDHMSSSPQVMAIWNAYNFIALLDSTGNLVEHGESSSHNNPGTVVGDEQLLQVSRTDELLSLLAENSRTTTKSNTHVGWDCG